MFPSQESNWGLLHHRRILHQLSYQGSPREFNMFPTTLNKVVTVIILIIHYCLLFFVFFFFNWRKTRTEFFQAFSLGFSSYPNPKSLAACLILFSHGTILTHLSQAFTVQLLRTGNSFRLMKPLGFWEHHSLLCNAGQRHGTELHTVGRGVSCWEWASLTCLSSGCATSQRDRWQSWERFLPVLTFSCLQEGEARGP